MIGTICIKVQACANPSSDSIVAMQVRFTQPSGPTTAWRAMSFTEGTGCVLGTYNWNSNEFGDGTVGIEARSADYNDTTPTRTPTSTSVPITYPGNRGLYVWDESIPGDTTKTTTLINFATSKSTDDIYILARRTRPHAGFCFLYS